MGMMCIKMTNGESMLVETDTSGFDSKALGKYLGNAEWFLTEHCAIRIKNIEYITVSGECEIVGKYK